MFDDNDNFLNIAKLAEDRDQSQDSERRDTAQIDEKIRLSSFRTQSSTSEESELRDVDSPSNEKPEVLVLDSDGSC